MRMENVLAIMVTRAKTAVRRRVPKIVMTEATALMVTVYVMKVSLGQTAPLLLAQVTA